MSQARALAAQSQSMCPMTFLHVPFAFSFVFAATQTEVQNTRLGLHFSRKNVCFAFIISLHGAADHHIVKWTKMCAHFLQNWNVYDLEIGLNFQCVRSEDSVREARQQFENALNVRINGIMLISGYMFSSAKKFTLLRYMLAPLMVVKWICLHFCIEFQWKYIYICIVYTFILFSIIWNDARAPNYSSAHT